MHNPNNGLEMHNPNKCTIPTINTSDGEIKATKKAGKKEASSQDISKLSKSRFHFGGVYQWFSIFLVYLFLPNLEV